MGRVCGGAARKSAREPEAKAKSAAQAEAENTEAIAAPKLGADGFPPDLSSGLVHEINQNLPYACM